MILAILLSALTVTSSYAKVVHYDLTATQKTVNLSGKKDVDFAIALNDQVPAPTLEFTEGDEAEIVVKNHIPGQELSIHWHGLLLPPEMDGVPYLTTPPIHSGEEYTFRFKLRQHGTYWYHSHTGLQEQKGVFGAFIIHPAHEKVHYDKDLVVMLNDWTDENPDHVLRNLKKDGDYYLYKKGNVRSWVGAIREKSLGNFLQNEWTRMGGMDLSDVGYDAFLINGKRDSQLAVVHPGQKIRLRIINAAASTYFYVALGQSPLTVIAADGSDIVPVAAKEIFLGMAETYDAEIVVPEHKNFELKATSQDGTGTASGWLGMGPKVFAPVRPAPPLYATMDHSAHAGHAGHGAHSGHSGHSAKPSPNEHSEHAAATTHADHNEHAEHSEHEGHEGDEEHTDHSEHASHESHEGHSHSAQIATPTTGEIINTLSVDDLKSPTAAHYPAGAKIHEIKLVLGGDMRRYTWFINGKLMSEEMDLPVEEGEILRFTFENTTMMHHPMHLHGHLFRVLNQNGSYSPIKHTVDIPPHGTRTIETLANEPGQWMFHCHNLYHMKSGMGRVVEYAGYTPSPEIAHWQMQDPHMVDPWYLTGMAEAATNHAQAKLRLSQTWNEFDARVESRNTSKSFKFEKEWELEGDIFYRRWINNYLNLIIGGTGYAKRESVTAGVGYLLPFLIESDLLVDHRGKFRLDLSKRFQWASSVFSDVDFSWRPNQKRAGAHAAEFEATLMYSPSWSWAAGPMFTEESIGVGAQVKF